MKNVISSEVLSALSPKLQGMTSDASILVNTKFTLSDIIVSPDTDANLSDANAKDNNRVRLLYKASTGKMFTFPIRSFINIDVLAKKGAKTSKKMYESLPPVSAKSKELKFPDFTITDVKDSLDNSAKVFPLWNYVLNEETQTEYFGKNPDATPQDYYNAHPRMRSLCLADGRVIDDTKNFKDISVVFS